VFGTTTALVGDWAFVGAPFASTPNNFRQGAVYVFHRESTGWRQTQRLVPAGSDDDDRFGHSLAFDGTRMIAGSPRFGGSENLSGAAYVFDLVDGQWTETAMLQLATPHRDDELGISVEISGDRAIVGASGMDPPGLSGTRAGGAAVFEFTNGAWSQVDLLFARAPVQFEGFGSKVAIDGPYALVATLHHPTAAGNNAGLAAFFVVPEPGSALLAILGVVLFSLFGMTKSDKYLAPAGTGD
jgi:hypothetical protein